MNAKFTEKLNEVLDTNLQLLQKNHKFQESIRNLGTKNDVENNDTLIPKNTTGTFVSQDSLKIRMEKLEVSVSTTAIQ